jgi:hypothetical protein
MKRIVEQHLARLRRAKRTPEDLESLRDRLFSHLYPSTEGPLKRVRQDRIPADAPDWVFEAELRKSGLWQMMERCYPSPQAQSQ